MEDRRADAIQQAYPLALGYMRRYPLMRVDEVARTQEALANHARRNGFTLGTVHVEDLLTDPQAFLEMVAAINLFDIQAVVIPTAAHLGDAVVPESKRAYFDRETKAQVLVAEPPRSCASRTGISEVP